MLDKLSQRLTGNLLRFISLLFVLCSFNIYAASEVIPTLTIKEYLLTNTTHTLDENGQITVISPGLKFINTQRRSQLEVDYAYHTELHHGLSTEDTDNHDLSLSFDISHIPEQWMTQIFGSIRQETTSPDGIQSVNPVLNDNTKELQTYGVSTLYQHDFKQLVRLETQLLADYADFEEDDSSESLGFVLSLDSQISRNKFYWNSVFSSRKTMLDDDNETIDSILIGLNYRLNHQYTVFFNSQSLDTSNTNFNDNSTLIGLNWTPNTSSNIRVGAGVRGDEPSYSLTALFKKRRYFLSINYTEDVTSSRNEVVGFIDDGTEFGSSFKSLIITPILQKRASIILTFNGNKSSLTFSYFNQRRYFDNTISSQEKTDSFKLSLNRKFSKNSTITTSYTDQNSQASEKNDLADFRITHLYQMSKKSNLTTELRKTRQESDVIDNEYENNIISLAWTVSF